jgi:hypothetical protein
MSSKTPLAEVAGLRLVTKTQMHLSAASCARLCTSTVEAVFSMAFLTRMSRLRRSHKQLYVARRNVINAAKHGHIKTFEDLCALTLEELQSGYCLGPRSLALVLDVMQYFGYEPASEPRARGGLLDDPELWGKRLAVELVVQ